MKLFFQKSQPESLKHFLNVSLLSTTTITSILMLLSRLAGVGNFCFNLLNLIWLYASSLLKPYHSRSFFTHSYYDFLGRPFFLLPVISSSITSRIWELMSWRMTWPFYRRRRWIITSSIFTTTLTLSCFFYFRFISLIWSININTT